MSRTLEAVAWRLVDKGKEESEMIQGLSLGVCELSRDRPGGWVGLARMET